MYKSILLPLDLVNRETQSKAVATTIGLAKAFGARVHALTVVPDFGMAVVEGYFPEDFEKNAMASAKEDLAAFVDAEFDADVSVKQIVAYGSVYREIIRAADDVACDLIVMASHSPALRDYLIGPNAVEVITHATRSVLVVRG